MASPLAPDLGNDRAVCRLVRSRSRRRLKLQILISSRVSWAEKQIFCPLRLSLRLVLKNSIILCYLACMAGANEEKNKLKGIPTSSLSSPFPSPIGTCHAGRPEVCSILSTRIQSYPLAFHRKTGSLMVLLSPTKCIGSIGHE